MASTAYSELTPAQIRHIRAARMVEAAQDYARAVNDYDDEPFFRARLLDELEWFVSTDLREEIKGCLSECGLDVEGYPLDDFGDRADADREFVSSADRSFERELAAYRRAQRSKVA